MFTHDVTYIYIYTHTYIPCSYINMLVYSWLCMLELANVSSLRLPSSHPLHQVRSKSATSQRQQQDVG